MRILFAIKGMENAGGGTERVVSVLAPALRARGHDVRLVTLDRSEATSFYALPEDLPWRKLGTANVGDKLTLCSSLLTLVRLRRLVRTERPDVAVGFMHSMYVPLAAALLGTRVPLIASEHIVPEYYRRRRLEYLLLILSSLRAQRVTALSQAIAARYPLPVRRRMIAVANPVAFADTAEARPADLTAPKTLLTIGRMDEQKDHATLVRAFAKIAQDFPDWRLRIVGDGPLRGRIEKLVAELGLQERVELPGTVRDTGREYGHAGIFVLPSRYESFGMVVAEALGHGLPVVAFADCPGANELLAHGRNGILVDGPERAQALADALARLIRDPGTRARLAAAGAESIASFETETVAARWEALLEQVCWDPSVRSSSEL